MALNKLADKGAGKSAETFYHTGEEQVNKRYARWTIDKR